MADVTAALMAQMVAVLGAALTLAGPAAAQGDGELRAFLDERAVIRVVDGIDNAVDAKEWPRARAYFADRVAVDFTSLAGGSPATIPADDLVGAWAANLKPAKTSLHLRTNHAVALDGDRAVVDSHGYAWNRLEGNGDPLWEVWGTYQHRLERTPDGWKVSGMTFVATHERGNIWVKTTVPTG